MTAYSSQLSGSDPRVCDLLLRHWRYSSLQYPLIHHYHHDHHHNDDTSVISLGLRELSLSVALAFIDAVRSATLQFLSTLHLTAFYTGQATVFMASGTSIYYSEPVGEWSIAISLSVCLFVHEHISGTAGPIFTKFVVQITCGRGSVLLMVALRYVMYVRFYG